MAEDEGEDFTKEPTGKWAFIRNDRTGEWHFGRTEEGAEEGEAAYDLPGEAENETIIKFLSPELQEILDAWDRIRGDQTTSALSLENYLLLFFLEAREVLKKFPK